MTKKISNFKCGYCNGTGQSAIGKPCVYCGGSGNGN